MHMQPANMKASREKKRTAALADPESDIAKKVRKCKGMCVLEQAQVFASGTERIWKVVGVHGPCVFREWPPLVRLGEASSTLATAFAWERVALLHADTRRAVAASFVLLWLSQRSGRAWRAPPR